MNKNIFLLISLSILSTAVFAQSYFTAYKNGEKSFGLGEYEMAISEFKKVIEAKADHDRAHDYLGRCYIAIKDYNKAIESLKNATSIKPNIASYQMNLGIAYFSLEQYNEAIAALSNAINNDKKLAEAYVYKSKSLMAVKKFEDALANAEAAISKLKNAENYYFKGLAQDSLKQYEGAVYSFKRALFYSKEMIDAHIGLAHAYMMSEKYAEALSSCDKALTMEPSNVKALLTRADVNIAKKSPQSAVEDISRIITVYPNEAKYYVVRGNVYQELNQNQNAIADYTKAIKLDKEDYFIYYQRAKSYETLQDFKSAIKDYETLRKITPYDGRAMKLYDEAKARLYELNKESNNPELVILDPEAAKEGKLPVPKGVDEYVVKGQINDESLIEFIKINGNDADYSKDSLNPKFEMEIDLATDKNVSITAFDIYKNSQTWVYEVVETEVDAPVVKLMAPYASDDGTIYLDSDDPTLYVEGIMNDESLISEIFVEGATASFVLNEKNPKFSATINIMNKSKFTVIASDIYGNKVEQEFTLNRENIELLGDNPMGKTWVVFIENADYKSFASLDGPTKDVTMMKSAFAKYKIHNVIHKKNMSKSKLEKFFSIELRDLVRSNRVNSVLVWYAGHGKFINESGYWIPVDAKRDEEFTYFNINNLKAAMQSYSKFITHTLVVTDACESGPSFYQAMRSTNKDKSCNDWQATRFKSSQVFSSAGYELASDNSQFTKTFANTLSSNPNSCIPIETIVTKVSSAVQKSGAKQKPKFGKIAGLEDENGTFFFIKK